VLALLTGQGDLGPNVGRSHGAVPLLVSRFPCEFVAEAGLEPATQRL
jgi:hypothetical protein